MNRAQKRFPDYSPIESLIALAETVAEVNPVLAKDCHAALLPYMAPKLRPIEADADALVELEGRLVRARVEAATQVARDDSLAERLLRAKNRIQVVARIERAPHESFMSGDDFDVGVAMPKPPRPPEPLPVEAAETKPEPEPEPKAEYTAVLPRAGVAAATWWPDEPAQATTDYNPLNDD
ncbi:hypothetical protein [Pseudooceanicola nitratireducens]|uniref:hypothetical protein n=1 Tax=Pseudooceanicola nitratireducens TaxID=517719 RepID=UPI001C94FDC4|nr:hypothetical protein [Pseudooceanicola nitratireducens]MBY6155815.1 hypothetical protein [Pseudooceanicola nitratireducens]